MLYQLFGTLVPVVMRTYLPLPYVSLKTPPFRNVITLTFFDSSINKNGNLLKCNTLHFDTHHNYQTLLQTPSNEETDKNLGQFSKWRKEISRVVSVILRVPSPTNPNPSFPVPSTSPSIYPPPKKRFKTVRLLKLAHSMSKKKDYSWKLPQD